MAQTEAMRWGTKYVVTGEVTAPDGNPVSLTTVWMVVEGYAPILVTAYPTRKKS